MGRVEVGRVEGERVKGEEDRKKGRVGSEEGRGGGYR